MIVSFRATPTATRFLLLVVESYLTHAGVDMVLPLEFSKISNFTLDIGSRR